MSTSRHAIAAVVAITAAAAVAAPSAAQAQAAPQRATDHGHRHSAVSAVAPRAGFMVTRDCQEQQAFVDGSARAVARALPRRYAPVADPATSAPVLFVRGLDCAAVTIAGRTAPAVIASFGVTVQSPDGTGCASAAPVTGPYRGDLPPACNWYTLHWLTTSRTVAGWLRATAPGFPVEYVPGLAFHLGAVDPTAGGEAFRLEVPASSGAPFTMTATARPRPGTIPVRGGYWHDGRAGQVKLVFASDNLTSGDATGTVVAPARSSLARLLGAPERQYLPVYSAIAAEHWDTAVYRPQLTAATPDDASFAGSCSVQGTVSFSPGATNTAQALRYDYPATGTCTGTLDGRAVNQAPVSWHHWGSAYGTCSSAQTRTPGNGTLTFGAGRTVTFTLDFTSTATQVSFGFYGTRSGMANGSGTFLTQRTQPTVLTDCAGAGATKVSMDLSMTTDTPLVSGHDEAQPRERRGKKAV
jgi:hypothetical protein